jgi:hypothetical protein
LDGWHGWDECSDEDREDGQLGWADRQMLRCGGLRLQNGLTDA